MTEKDLLGSALEAVKGAKWIPDWGEARIELMLKGSPDWCVSRQRTWGCRLPCLCTSRHRNCIRVRKRFLKIATLIEKQGMDAWFEQAEDFLGAEAEDYEKVSDTLDVWFDSGVTHFLCCSDAMSSVS